MKHKMIWVSLTLVILLTGSYFLYNKLTHSLSDQDLANSATTPFEEQSNISDEEFDFTFQNAAGDDVQLSSFKGKPIVLNFWASWCPPCRFEMPLLADYEAKKTDTVFLYVNQTDGSRETQAKAEEFLENTELDMDVYYDRTPNSAIKYGLTALPATYFINKDGDIHSRVSGAITEATLVSSLININAN